MGISSGQVRFLARRFACKWCKLLSTLRHTMPHLSVAVSSVVRVWFLQGLTEQ